MSKFNRDSTPDLYAVDSEVNAKILDCSVWAGGSIETEAAVTVTLVGTNYDNPVGRTFKACYDKTGAPVVIICSAAGVWALPDAFYNYRYVKLTGTSATVGLFRKG